MYKMSTHLLYTTRGSASGAPAPRASRCEQNIACEEVVLTDGQPFSPVGGCSAALSKPLLGPLVSQR